MGNPNDYDDDKYLEASNELDSAVASLWAAGAELEDIEEIFKNALENHCG